MEGAVGDGAWVNTSRKKIERTCKVTAQRGPKEKGFESMGKRTMSGRVLRDTSGRESLSAGILWVVSAKFE